MCASAALISAAQHHRVHLLLAESLLADDLREPLAAALVAELRAAAIADALRERELRRLLSAFSVAGIDTLLLKGAGLAYTVYTAPHLRPRCDVDLLVAPERLADAHRLLAAEGWTRAAEPDSMVAAAQCHYERQCPGGITEHLDLHWRIANPRVFGDAIAFEELWTRSVAVPVLGTSARTLSTTDALLVACMHRVAHHQDTIDLLWLWDIHLLASRLSTSEATRFIDLAVRKRMRAVCARGLALSAECFQTPGASALVAALETRSSGAEPTAQFLGGHLRMVDLLHADLAATRAWRARVTLVREHLFPSRSYMDSAYARWPAALLPLTYAHRILRGAPKWFRRP